MENDAPEFGLYEDNKLLDDHQIATRDRALSDSEIARSIPSGSNNNAER